MPIEIKMKTIVSHILLLIFLFTLSEVSGQVAPDSTLDLSIIANGERWAVFNRAVTIAEKEQKRSIYLDEKPGQGVAWLPSFEFGDGVIEVDVKGRNEPGRSFVGLAFHGVDAEHYELVYLRPFNFRAESEVGRSHLLLSSYHHYETISPDRGLVPLSICGKSYLVQL